MLEQIIEETISNEKIISRQTTIGRIRIEKKQKSKERQIIEDLYKSYDPNSEANRTFEERLWSEDAHQENREIDFYGLNNAHNRNHVFKTEFNENIRETGTTDPPQFDQPTKKKSSSTVERTTNEDLKNEPLNEIDQQYFGTLKQFDPVRQTTVEVKQVELPRVEELNYIDQLAFPELTEKKISSTVERETIPKTDATDPPEFDESTKKKSSSTVEQTTNEDLKNEPLNEIDQQYFGTLKQFDPVRQSTKKVENPRAEQLNYIEQLVLNRFPKEKISNPDKVLNIQFQYAINKPIEKDSKTKTTTNVEDSSMTSFNPKLETMRSIKPKDYFDPPRLSDLDEIQDKETEKTETAEKPAQEIRQTLTTTKSNRDTLGYRVFDHLVPNWSKMTKAEIVDVLVKQICFVKDGILALDKPYGLPTLGGPDVRISVAHAIPQMIERLNRADIQQLHLLNRLDKQSTGVLLMA